MAFRVQNITDADFSAIELSDDITGSRAVVLPEQGAILHRLERSIGGAMRNVIESYDNQADWNENLTNKGFRSCKLAPFACRIDDARYRFDDHEYHIEKFLLNGSALHGLIYDLPFQVAYQYADAHHAGVVLQGSYLGTDPGYPFAFDCQVAYQLKANAALTVTTTLTNRDEGLIPVQDGWHPYFTLGVPVDDCLLSFQAMDQWVFNAAMIPTGERKSFDEFIREKKLGNRKFDDCFTLDFSACQPLVTLRHPNEPWQVEIHPDKSYPYLQLYTPDHRQSIAIENLSAPPDVFNHGAGLIILPPGGNRNFVTKYRINSWMNG